MIFILEGPDGSGKTTLARTLMQRFNIKRYVHMGVPEPVDRPFDYWMKRLLPHAGPVVIDRLHWSEDIYGQLFRGGSRLTDLDRWQLEGWLLAQGATIIQCLPPLEVVTENVAQDVGGLHHDHVTDVWNAFADPWETHLPLVYYSYPHMAADALADSLFKVAELPAAHEGIGSPRPRYVFVADRHNICNVGCYSPFVLRCPAGDHLRRALEHVGLSFPAYQVINGWRLGNGGAYNINEAIYTLRDVGPPPHRFVAMGHSARRALEEAGIKEHGFVYHPQHERRFHYHDTERYGEELLKEATDR